MKKFVSHYDILKISHDAPPEVVGAAYRALSKKFHPDLNHCNSDAARNMVIINASYEVLSNPEKRREYDLWLERQEIENAHGEKVYQNGNENDSEKNGNACGSKKQNAKADLNEITKYCFDQKLKIEDLTTKGGCFWVIYKNNEGLISSKLSGMGFSYSKKRQSWWIKLSLA